MSSHLALNLGDTSSGNPGQSSFGHGQIFDSGGINSGDGTGGGLPSFQTGNGTGYRSQYHLDQSEILKGLANRFVHSTAYLYLYGSMALASLLTVIMSIANECPGTIFYVVEMLVNVVLVVEVAIRFVAFGRQFWHSTFNILDLFLVFLCTLTLLIIFFSHDCSPYNRNNPDRKGRGGRQGKGEELLDSFLLIFRNGMQLMRLLAVVRRSGRNAFTRPSRIEVLSNRNENARLGGSDRMGGPNSVSLDIDLRDEERETRNRIRDGGGGQLGRNKKGTERENLMRGQEYEDDEEEEEL
ncbi:unnamed protein product [Sympodiomycopsis kandeliae]